MRTTVARCRVAVIALAALGAACAPSQEPELGIPESRRLEVADILGGGDATGFDRALEPTAFRFPADHGSHPAFRNEWWYFTGNLSGPEGERYGYQLTVFRSSLSPRALGRESAWATREVYMAHLAVGDERGGTFVAHDRFARGAVGLAGAEADPLRVWLEDWEIAALRPAGPSESGVLPGATVSLPPVRLRAAEAGTAIDLTLESERPLVLNGELGLSQKGPSPGNASYYYSAPRLRTRGTVRVGGEPVAVEGLSWLDREWSTSALEGEQTGWDWFALHLEDGRDLMVYLLRERTGAISAQSAGTLVEPDGVARHLDLEEIVVRPLDTWTSPRGSIYPSRWRIQVSSAGIDVGIAPILDDQELDVAFRYWEGAVVGSGESGGRPVVVEGFVELTGY